MLSKHGCLSTVGKVYLAVLLEYRKNTLVDIRSKYVIGNCPITGPYRKKVCLFQKPMIYLLRPGIRGGDGGQSGMIIPLMLGQVAGESQGTVTCDSMQLIINREINIP